MCRSRCCGCGCCTKAGCCCLGGCLCGFLFALVVSVVAITSIAGILTLPLLSWVQAHQAVLDEFFNCTAEEVGHVNKTVQAELPQECHDLSWDDCQGCDGDGDANPDLTKECRYCGCQVVFALETIQPSVEKALQKCCGAFKKDDGTKFLLEPCHDIVENFTGSFHEGAKHCKAKGIESDLKVVKHPMMLLVSASAATTRLLQITELSKVLHTSCHRVLWLSPSLLFCGLAAYRWRKTARKPAHRFAAYRAKVLQLLPQRVLQQYIDFEKQGQYSACIKLLESATPGSLNVLSPATMVSGKPLLVETVPVLQLIVGYSGLCLKNQQGSVAVKLITQVLDNMSLSLRDLHPGHRTVLEAYLFDTALSVCYYMPNDVTLADRSQSFFQQASERYLRLGHVNRYCKCCLRAAAVLHLQGSKSEAEYYTQQALNKLSDAPVSSLLAICYHNLAVHTVVQQRVADAVAHVRSYVALLRQLPKLGNSWMQLLDNTQWLILKAQELWPQHQQQDEPDAQYSNRSDFGSIGFSESTLGLHWDFMRGVPKESMLLVLVVEFASLETSRADFSPTMAGKDSSMQAFVMDFMLGGVSGAVSKTLTAPIERVKLVVQTQDANPKIRSGEVPRYTGMLDCAQRIMKEQGFKRFWDGNLTNCIRYFPTQAFNLAFKDTFKKMFPKYNPKTEFWQFFGSNLVSGGLAAAASMTIVYPLDYARTRLASDVGSGKKTFSGLGDCIVKTTQGPGGFFALYTGFGVSVCGIIGYRGLQLGTFDTITGLNPYKKDKGILGAVSTFAAAQTAITIGAGCTYPFDTVRRRLQMQSEKPPEEHIYKGTADCFKKIAAEEGLVAGLYKGFLANVVRSVGGALVL
ncbi:unnamed protein product, partial [Symbiodinium sp. KB8]